MTFEYDIFTFYVFYEHRNLRIMMTEYQPESGDAIIVDKPIDMTYVVNDSVYNQAKDLIAEYDEEHN
tara:strand:- start:5883 stop:6083 length:201 start_codon:yes stop_codon:yes gene_type:complete